MSMTGNVTETAAESQQRLRGLSLGGGGTPTIFDSVSLQFR